jgi:hypothetical protein
LQQLRSMRMYEYHKLLNDNFCKITKSILPEKYMSQFNIFMNAYQQPENKLTYNFLCLLEHLPLSKQKALLEFLLDQRFRLAPDPRFVGTGVFSGQVSNPDGKLRVCRDDGQTLEIYLENKTCRSRLSRDQLLHHMHTYCHNDTTFLLVLTPRPSDFPIVQACLAEVGPKLLFKTWGDIAQQLQAFVRQDQDFLAAQFLEYGTLSGEFTDMELEASDILHYVSYHRREVVKRLRFVLTSAVREIDYAQWDASIRYTGSADGYGRMGCCFQVANHYGLEWFFGIYYHPCDHQLPLQTAWGTRTGLLPGYGSPLYKSPAQPGTCPGGLCPSHPAGL